MPVFSEIEIEFLIDYEVGYSLAPSYIDQLGTISIEPFDWVVTRSTTGEVTTGTPTGTAGETTAINFESAFSLDNPTGFVITRTVNSVLIQSETEGFDFIGITSKDENLNNLILGVDYNVVFNNYTAPIDTSNIEFALVKSPYYVNIPFNFDTTTSASLDLYVWDGDLGTLPATPTYSLTFPRPATNFAEFNIDLSKLISEQLEPVPVIDLTSTTQIINSTDDSVKWVQYVASYTDTVETIADIQGTFTALDGYGYYNQGVNPTKPTNNILTEANIRKVSRDGCIIFPFINNSFITTIDINSNTNQINATETITETNESTEIVQYLEVDVSQATTDQYITITTQPAGDVITYEIVDECRYNPIQVIFKNRYGVYDSLTLFKKSNVSISTKNDDFINNYVNNGTYDVTKHQYQKLNVTAKKTLKVNSGYINELENELYQQLLYSEKVWFYENNALVPVNVKSSSLKFKTRVNDKLVNYSIDFEYAYSIIQNI